MLDSKLWWKGPEWLLRRYPADKKIIEAPSLERRQAFLLTKPIEQNKILSKFSVYSKLQRVIVFCLRFIYNARNPTRKRINYLTSAELRKATIKITKLVQREEFFVEIETLRKDKLVHKSSKLVTLNPFMDSEDFLRVSRRLRKANIAFEIKQTL